MFTCHDLALKVTFNYKITNTVVIKICGFFMLSSYTQMAIYAFCGPTLKEIYYFHI